jgi:cobalt/nickel transport system permease protein
MIGVHALIGVGVTVVAGSAVFWAVRRRRGQDVSPSSTGV